MKICRAVRSVILILYGMALAVFLFSALGLIGVEGDPMSGIFLILLAQPWTMLVDPLPEPWWPLVLALLPVVNLTILWLLCGWVNGLLTRRGR